MDKVQKPVILSVILVHHRQNPLDSTFVLMIRIQFCTRVYVGVLTLNGGNIPFVNSVKYLGVIFDNKITWRLHIEMIEAKAFRIFIRIYSLFKRERLSANIKLTLHKSLIDL
jgi:hypothetical protein